MQRRQHHPGPWILLSFIALANSSTQPRGGTQRPRLAYIHGGSARDAVSGSATFKALLYR